MGDDWNRIQQSIFVIFSDDAAFAPYDEFIDGKSIFRGLPETSRSGTAAAITTDGYLITDMHVLGQNVWVFGYIGEKMGFLRARIVHEEATEEYGSEVALLHIEGLSCPAISLGRITPELERVIAVGTHREGPLNIEPLAGRLTTPPMLPVDGKSVVLRSDLPFKPGDSGGPLLTVDGDLIGVNNSWVRPWHSLKITSLSCAPDPDTIRGIIEEDRRRPSKTKPSL